MIVNIAYDWRIETDNLNWVVQHRRVVAKGKTKGKIFWDNMAYCKSLDSAIIWCGRRRIMELPGEYNSDALSALVEALDGIQNDCRKAAESACTARETTQ